MSLIPCKECGESISTTASACPKCGAKIPRARIWPWVVGIPIGLFVLFIGYGMTIPEYKNRARQEREVCYKIAAYYDRGQCDINYSKAIEQGGAAAAK